MAIRAQRDVKTFVGTGKAGTELSPPQLSEPAGLSAAKGMLFVADTNNHRICVVDLKSGEMTELTLDVFYQVQGNERYARLSTLVDSSLSSATGNATVL